MEYPPIAWPSLDVFVLSVLSFLSVFVFFFGSFLGQCAVILGVWGAIWVFFGGAGQITPDSWRLLQIAPHDDDNEDDDVDDNDDDHDHYEDEEDIDDDDDDDDLADSSQV